MKTLIFYLKLIFSLLLLFPGLLEAQEVLTLPGVDISIKSDGDASQDLSIPLRIAIGLTILSLAPAILIMMTSFTRIVIVLSLLRHALGMQQTPPNTVIISLSIFLTIFSMMPVFEKLKVDAYIPYMEKQYTTEEAIDVAKVPVRDFMISQTREQDLALMIDVSKSKMPETVEDVQLTTLIPAFILSELKSAFQIGFIIFLPFLLIDSVVASILMSMGMLMVPPMMISLPIKILMFVLIDGWNLVTTSLLGSFM